MNNATRVFTPAVQQAQVERGSSKAYERRIAEGFPDRITAELAKFIAEQDTAFIATATANGAPYVQHRGGPKGFIKVVDDKTLGFADYRGNRQYITLANRMVENDPALIERLFDQGYKARPERVILFTVEAWDVNCSAHIVTRFTEEEIEEAFVAVRDKIAELETENARLRAALAKQPASPPE